MKDLLKTLARALASVECTLLCLALMMVLTVGGTLAQAKLGAFAAMAVYFNSFLVWLPVGSIKLPVFPGGLSIGILWLASLISAFILHFRLDRRQIGLYLSHLGIIILLLGQVVTQLMARESHLSIELGQTRNYSESQREVELAIVEKSAAESDEVVSIPVSRLRTDRPIETALLPFTISTKAFFPNSDLGQIESGKPSLASQGIGTQVSARAKPITQSDDESNIPSAYIELNKGGKSLGTWLVSAGLGAPQPLSLEGKDYEFYLRPHRSYYPFSLTLNKFTHDVYPGTEIPRNFASTVRLDHPARGESRDALIYMNHPLRYEGLTFYQASYGKNDTLSVLQVVRNPVWLTPYLSCIMVTIGLLLHFLTRFIVSRSHK